MRLPPDLLERNRRWADRMRASDPEFFRSLSVGQHPKYLWIGCSDSRVPANQIVDLPPGELFVHRNLANLCECSDTNFSSVLHYAVDVLRVWHVIVCGHYGCGGVRAAAPVPVAAPIGTWLRPLAEISRKHSTELEQLPNADERRDRLCELNVMEQVGNLARTSVVQRAWRENRPLTLHGWIYNLEDGRLRDLRVGVDSGGD